MTDDAARLPDVTGDHCPTCGARADDLWRRPDGTRVCGRCVRDAGARGS
jgi:hypothetical protein